MTATTTASVAMLKAQHAQIDDLFQTVAMLRDPDALDELCDTVVVHLALEQELLYPALACSVSPEVADELREEHLAIKRTLGQLVWCGVDDPDFAAHLARLRELLDGHEGYQEDQLFSAYTAGTSASQSPSYSA